MTDAQPKPRILVVDDEAGARTALAELLREEGYEVHSAADGFKALGRVDTWSPDVVITDVKMPGMDGVELMQKLRERFPELIVLVMTAFGSVENAVQAIHRGADDYLTKPLHLGQLLVVLERVLRHRSLQAEAERLRAALHGGQGGQDPGFIGQSKPLRDLLELVRQVADSDASVLITGEGGTGKELAARALHQWSHRKDGPFITLHCGSLSEAVLETELFGAEAGASESSPNARIGRLEQAHRGTLFLDGVGELPQPLQARLLRFMQARSFERTGGRTAIEVDVRIVASTSKELRDDVAAGRFREDLYYRLNVITLRMPTLRERRDDIPSLATYFLKQYAQRNHKVIRGYHERALGVLLNYDWPGNVRQLENCIERAVVLSRGDEIEPRHLPRELMQTGRKLDEAPVVPGASLKELERFAILRTLEHVGGSTSKAARILGISPRKIQYRLNEYRDADPTGLPILRREGRTTDAELDA
jgi:two-component system response regulator HydG